MVSAVSLNTRPVGRDLDEASELTPIARRSRTNKRRPCPLQSVSD
jgi:hypothetical protein